MVEPLPDDVVVQEHRSNPHTVYRVGTVRTPDQFTAETRAMAVEIAKGYARDKRVRAWFQAPNGAFTLLYVMD